MGTLEIQMPFPLTDFSQSKEKPEGLYFNVSSKRLEKWTSVRVNDLRLMTDMPRAIFFGYYGL